MGGSGAAFTAVTFAQPPFTPRSTQLGGGVNRAHADPSRHVGESGNWQEQTELIL
jgi:hypothetical protein